MGNHKSAIFNLDDTDKYDYTQWEDKAMDDGDEIMLTSLMMIYAARKCKTSNDKYFKVLKGICNGTMSTRKSAVTIAVQQTRYRPVLDLFQKYVTKMEDDGNDETITNRRRDFEKAGEGLLDEWKPSKKSKKTPVESDSEVESSDSESSDSNSSDSKSSDSDNSDATSTDSENSDTSTSDSESEDSSSSEELKEDESRDFLRGLRSNPAHYNARVICTDVILDNCRFCTGKDVFYKRIQSAFQDTLGWIRSTFLKAIAAIQCKELLALFKEYAKKNQSGEKDVFAALEAKSAELKAQKQAKKQAKKTAKKDVVKNVADILIGTNNDVDMIMRRCPELPVQNSDLLLAECKSARKKDDNDYQKVQRSLQCAIGWYKPTYLKAIAAIRCKAVYKLIAAYEKSKGRDDCKDALKAKKAEFKRAGKSVLDA